VAIARGIGFRVVEGWQGDRSLERQLKRLKHSPWLCPLRERERRQTRTYTPTQLSSKRQLVLATGGRKAACLSDTGFVCLNRVKDMPDRTHSNQKPDTNAPTAMELEESYEAVV